LPGPDFDGPGQKGEATSEKPKQRALEEFNTACREAVNFARQLVNGQVKASSPDLLALAKRAAEQCAARKNEDVEAWAERLARDISNTMD
jgi:hypothetical protein